MNALPILLVAVVTVTEGYRHESIPAAEEVIAAIADRTGWFTPVFIREEIDLQRLAPERLGDYSIVMFVNTTGELPLPDRDALVQWVRGGGTFVGVHSASDTLHSFDAYLDMIGGEFDFHGAETAAEVWIEEVAHPSTGTLQSPMTMFEEYYHFKRFDPEAVHLLAALHLLHRPRTSRRRLALRVVPAASHRRHHLGAGAGTAGASPRGQAVIPIGTT
jgi:type 1 glutamine amidotransferase